MLESPVTDPVEAQWLAVSDSLMRGVSHALSNRLGAISAIARVLEGTRTDQDPLLETLRAEVHRLEEVALLLQLIPHERARGEEAIHLPDLLDELVALYALQGPVRDIPCNVEVTGEVLSVREEPGRLAHALLLLLNCAARAVQVAGEGALAVRCTGNEETVSVTIESRSAPGGTDRIVRSEDMLDPLNPQTAVAILNRWRVHGDATRWRAVVEEETNPDPACVLRLRLVLPSLLAVRRKEGGDYGE